MTTIATILARDKGGPGFDTLRLVLSVSILCFHSVLVSYGSAIEAHIWNGPAGGLVRALLPIFFALSGFLVMGSALRTPQVSGFLALRALRIVPALAAEISLSALLLGAICTTTPLAGYFTSRGFFGYFGSIIGRVRTGLPGIFETNPYPGIMNSSLWTIPPELICYIWLALVIIAGVHTSRRVMSLLCAGLVALAVAGDLVLTGGQSVTAVPVKLLVLAFVMGNVCYLWRDRVIYSAPLFSACLVFGVVTIGLPGWAYLALPALTYCVVFAGCTRLPRVPILSGGDYSYGIYLYAFPVQQTVAFLAPGLRQWYWNIAMSLPVAIALAMVSWHLVERPALRLRRRLHSAATPARPSLVAGFAGLAGLSAYAVFLAHDSGLLPVAAGDWPRLAEIGCGVLSVALLGTLARVLLRRAALVAAAGEPPVSLAAG